MDPSLAEPAGPPFPEGRETLEPIWVWRWVEPAPAPLPLPDRAAVLRSLWFFLLTSLSVYVTGGVLLAVGLLSILLAHEMGHYLVARYYRVDASLPYFIPLPLVSFVGTLGAFIRLRSRIPNRRALFDIGVAGPLAGFVVCLPVLWLGVLEGQWVPLRGTGEGPEYFGEPLFFQWAVSWLKGPTPEGTMLGIGPLGLAAWFGLFVTALNLIPVGQLDGGHAVYALAPRWARRVSRVGLVVCLLLLYHRPTWLAWTVLLLLLGRRPHPPTGNDGAPLGWPRAIVGLLAFAIFAGCFTPDPILLSWSDFAEALRELGRYLVQLLPW